VVEIASATERRDLRCATEPPAILTPPPGPESRRLAERAAERECPSFGARRRERRLDLPFVIERGQGGNLFDVDGNRYVDLAAGFGAASFGHGPSVVHARAARQIGDLVQGLGDMLPSAVKIELMERLAALHPDPRAAVMLGQSGADALTAAIKTAALTTGKPGLVAFDGAYHGLSYAPLAACGFAPSFRRAFTEQLNPHVTFAPFPAAENELGSALEVVAEALARGGVGAILVEPIQGRGGVVIPPATFLPELRALCDRFGALLIVDEIWTGMGRSGELSLCVRDGVVADVLCFGKGLGASFPISACIGSERAMSGWAQAGPVVHTSTHAGAPLGCAAALAVVEALDATTLAEIRERGAQWLAVLQTRLEPVGARVRGRGMMLGVEVSTIGSGPELFTRLIERGWLVTLGGARAEVLVLTPPLFLDAALASSFADELAALLATGGS
jgi:4-aminobutyrate aminotransferase / (S)-3-amino-2-methylpropionate transaminase / 5-aminovalerate transaminase